MITVIATLAIAGTVVPRLGVNVVLKQAPTPELLSRLSEYGTVLDVLPQINGVTLRADATHLSSIQSEPFVAEAQVEGVVHLSESKLTIPSPAASGGFVDGANHWALDAINVTDALASGRTVPHTGEGVYVAVIDSGLFKNWRDYFPEDRIADEFAAGFVGGNGESVRRDTTPQFWQEASHYHGTGVTGILLGWRYHFAAPALPPVFNGVAPNVKVIPIRAFARIGESQSWVSEATAAILYCVDLKASGALGSAPLILNLSWGTLEEDVFITAATNYALDHGVIVVASGGNESDLGMSYPAATSRVISVANVSFVRQFLDPTHFVWITDDVMENSAEPFLMSPDSSFELDGQDLDVGAPGAFTPMPLTVGGKVDYGFFGGTSAACPHVAGVAALMLEKNPTLTQSQIESILESTALPLPPGSRTVRGGRRTPKPEPSLSREFFNVEWVDGLTFSWEANTTGAGLVQANAALAATPNP